MSNINYAVEIRTDSSGISSDTFGLASDGYFRWITGRPSYNGTPTYPVWEDDTDNIYKWHESIISKNGISNPSRRIDITVSGEYGTLSGITISVMNHAKFFDYIETNDIYLIGRRVRVFCVIDDKFYQIWNGIVQNLPYTETSFKLDCKDDYKQIHKVIPPNVISPSSSDDSTDQGETIPVIIGDVAFTKLIDAGYKPEYINLVSYEGLLSYEYNPNSGLWGVVPTPSASKTFKQCGVNIFYGYSVGIGYEIGLKTSENLPFAEGELTGYYLIGTSGDGLETEIATRILYNYASAYGANGEWQTIVRICGDFGGLYASDIDSHLYNAADPTDNWWFAIVRLTTTLIAADNSITEFVKDEKNSYYIYKYDSDTKTYERIDHLLSTVGVTGIQGYDYPGINLIANQLTLEGDISILAGIVPEQYRCHSESQTAVPRYRYVDENGTQSPWYENLTADFPQYIIDKNVNTYYEGAAAISGATATQHEYDIYLLVPEDKLSDNISELYIGLDYTVDNDTHTGNARTYWNVIYLDPYGSWMNRIDESFVYPADGSKTSLPINCYCLPLEYYKGGTSWVESGYVGENHFWGRSAVNGDETVIYNDLFRIDSETLTNIKEGKVGNIILIKVYVEYDSPQQSRLYLYQAGFTARRTIDVLSDNIYARVSADDQSGATGVQASVYSAFKTILEDYDGYGVTGSTGDPYIDYSNLPIVRSDWYVGRTLTERKNSYEYLNELCKQSFIGMFPDRRGNRKLVAWRDLTEYTTTIGSTGILRDTITDFEKTQASQVYNDFKCQYSYNQATKKYDRCLIVTKTYEDVFPDSSDESWKNYVQGVNTNSYADAKNLWDIAHNGYVVTNTVTQNSTDTQNLNWYYDPSIFNNTTFIGASVDDAAFRFLQNLVVWSGLQKSTCKLSLPLSPDNIQLELLDMVYFEDGFYTDGVARNAWITKVEVDTSNNLLKLEITIEPIEIVDYDIIIERGIPLNVDTIVESGSQPDIIVET